MKLTATTANQYEKTIVFGPGKTGKTRIVGRLAQHYQLDYVDGESGVKTLLDPLNLEVAYRDNVTVCSLPDDGVNAIMFTTLWRILRSGGPVTVCDAHGRADCPDCKKTNAPSQVFNLFAKDPNRIFVIDSLTQLTTSCLAYVTRGKPDDYQMQIQDWGKVKLYMEGMLSVVQTVPANVIAITHESIEEFEDGKKRIVPVCGSAKFSVTVSKYFDHVVYCESIGKLFKYSSGSAVVPNVATGSRSNIKTELAPATMYTPLQLIYTKGIV